MHTPVTISKVTLKKTAQVSAFLVLCCDLRHVCTQQGVLRQRALRHLFPELNAM